MTFDCLPTSSVPTDRQAHSAMLVDWQARIDSVKYDSLSDINYYRKAREDFAKATTEYAVAKRHKKSSPHIIKGETPEEIVAKMKRKCAQKTLCLTRHAIELKLAKAFIPELMECCEIANEKAFRTETKHLETDAEREAYLFGLLKKTLDGLKADADGKPHHRDDQAYDTEALSPRQTPLDKTKAWDAGEREWRMLPTPRGLQWLEKERARKEIDPISLADTISDIWLATARTNKPRSGSRIPRAEGASDISHLQKPAWPENIPYIYDVIEEMLGNKHAVIPTLNLLPAPSKAPATPTHTDFHETVLEGLPTERFPDTQVQAIQPTKGRIVTPRTDIDDPSLPASNTRF